LVVVQGRWGVLSVTRRWGRRWYGNSYSRDGNKYRVYGISAVFAEGSKQVKEKVDGGE
jgi:hypothetical protein